MAARFTIPSDSSESSENEEEYAQARLARLRQYLDRRDRGDASPGFSDEPSANPEQLAQARLRNEEREQFYNTRMTTNDWCKCGNKCVPVLFAKTAFDVECCQENHAIQEICEEHLLFGHNQRYKCITEHPSFYHLCLYPTLLEKMGYLYSKAGHPGVLGRNRNAARRYVAYRQFTVWIHGKCGYKDRRNIPQCVTKRIKEAFSSTIYRGFEEPKDSNSESSQQEADSEEL